MVNWESEYKRHLIKKYEEMTGNLLSAENIIIKDVMVSLDVSVFSIEELSYMYAFAVMNENFEQAEYLKNELSKRDCELKLDIDEVNKIAILNVYVQLKTEIQHIDIKMKILPDGLMIDWEEDDNL